MIGIDIEAVNFAAEYRDRVFAEFLREYSAGRTPNPDVLCNAEIKFKAFLDHAMRAGRRAHRDRALRARAAAHGAAGRRVRAAARRSTPQGPELLPAPADQAQLARAMFPVGAPAQARGARRSRARHRPAERREEGLDRHLLHRRAAVPRVPEPLPAARDPGRSRPTAARVVGEHVGLAFYTLGQRKGIGIGGTARRQRRRPGTWRARTSAQQRAVPWCRGTTIRGCCRAAGRAEQAHWIAGEAPRDDGQPRRPRPATGRRDAPLHAARRCRAAAFALEFEQPQWAVTPGQSRRALSRRGLPGRRLIIGSAGLRRAVPAACGRAQLAASVSMKLWRANSLSAWRARFG